MKLEWESVAAQGQVPVVLIRHGQTAANLERRFLGRTDLPLDEEGERQARALGARLAGMERQALWSSPLLRARQTAAVLGEPRLHPDLAELDQGELEGMKAEEAFARWPDFFRAWAEDPGPTRVPGGESLGECQARSLAALAEIVRDAAPGPPVVVVAHQMVMASVILSIRGEPLRGFRSVKLLNTSITLLGWSGAWTLHATNDARHLEAAG